MKPVKRYQSKLLLRKSYMTKRIIRIRPATKLMISFRPVGFGQKPRMEINEYATD